MGLAVVFGDVIEFPFVVLELTVVHAGEVVGTQPRIEARVGVSAAATGLRHRADGTLDLSGFG